MIVIIHNISYLVIVSPQWFAIVICSSASTDETSNGLEADAGTKVKGAEGGDSILATTLSTLTQSQHIAIIMILNMTVEN